MNNTIMIVDDEIINIEIISENLSDDYNIIKAQSGEEAMELMSRQKPDMVLLDVYMPNIGGFEVLKFMKENDELKNIPVIFVSGEHDFDIEEEGLALGAVDYVKKPFIPGIVRVKVQNHLELKTYRDNLELMVEKRTKELMASKEAIIMGMSLMSDLHDNVTGDHIDRIKKFTQILAKKVRELYPDVISHDLVKQTVLFSPMHDVGKVAIPDAILKKPGVLTRDEFSLMESHTSEGANLLRKTKDFFPDVRNSDELQTAIDISESHHEKYDGTGYPNRLVGEAIPISARIVAVADVYDALRSPRPYKKSFSHEDSMKIITVGDDRTKAAYFDPKVLCAFKAVADDFNKIYEENKSDNELDA